MMFLLLLSILSFLFNLPSPSLSLTQDGLILLQAKQTLYDPDSVLSSWSSLDATPCSWHGVSCGASGNISVSSLDLSDSNLAGPLPTTHLCRLKALNFLSFANNFINDSLPIDISSCQSLIHLDLSQNLLTGSLPSTLSDLPKLTYMDLSGNNFSGDIPESFGGFRKLEVISLVYNLLDGVIPPSLGNISSLKTLNLSYNPFSPGRIPPEIGNLTNLEILWLTDCNLLGEIPESLDRLKKLTDFDLAENNLVGKFPSFLTGLTRLYQIELYNNSLTGELPPALGNLTELRNLDVSINELTGSIPDELCQLPLGSLNLYQNNLVGNLPASIANSPNLYELRLFLNRLTGELPINLGKNSPLRWMDVSSNQFTGRVPPGVCSKGELEEFLMVHNDFTGEFPESLSNCRSLTRVRLTSNRLSGKIPRGFWGLPHIYLVDLVDNSFTGQIANSIVNAGNLTVLLLDKNGFDGSLPEEIGYLENLYEFSASQNKLRGSLPKSLVNLRMIGIIDLHNNSLSGHLPDGIDSWKKMNALNLANNRFSGEITQEIGSLTVLNYLDLSNNQFSGKVPFSLQNLKLNQFNLSNNRLSGDLPPQFAKELYRSSFLGNPGLCGDIEGLCDVKRGEKGKGYVWLMRLLFIIGGLVFIIGVLWFVFKYKNYKNSRAINRKWTLMSFHKLGFSEDEILSHLNEDNVIGSGSSGKVYKVILSNGEAVAVKKLWRIANKEGDNSGVVEVQIQNDGFEAEVQTLGKIRHKNIVKLWCCCMTRDCKLLVYEYMPNGSLGDVLHSSKAGVLDWPTRFRIILDAAEGLSYLHHDCVPPIVHRDVKSNNILLDGHFKACIADFGVAKAIDSTEKPKLMSVIAGSCGYIAPEYAYTLRVNEKSDIYSFGVVILELVTGKLPVDPEFGQKDIVKWVNTTIDQKGMDHVLDPKLGSCFKEDICEVLRIGLICTNPLPISRPSMRRVVKFIQEIGADNLAKNGTKDGTLTPYYYEDTAEQGPV